MSLRLPGWTPAGTTGEGAGRALPFTGPQDTSTDPAPSRVTPAPEAPVSPTFARLAARAAPVGEWVRRLTSTGRLSAFVRRHPTMADTALALVVAGITVGHYVDRPFDTVLHFLLTMPLALRRKFPMAVFGFISAVAFVQWLNDFRSAGDFALLIALYTVAAHRPRRHMVAAVLVMEFGALIAALRWTATERVGNVFLAMSAMIVAAATLGSNLRTRRAYLTSLEDRAARLEREQDQQSRLAVAAERARIAREMHDIVTHNLSVMVALADAAAISVPSAPGKATIAMEQVSGTGRQALTEMRRFLGVLRADEPEAARHPQPDLERLAELADQVRAAGLPAVFTLEGDPRGVPQGAQLAAYRVVQEALTNTMKHSLPGASARIRVRCTTQSVELDVLDDGRPRRAGASAGYHAGTPAPAGHGIAGMRERAAVYGGDVDAGPLTGGGWRVHAVLNFADDTQTAHGDGVVATPTEEAQ